MKKLFLWCVLLANISFGQSKKFSDPDSILTGNKKLPKVLLVGSWHFNYPGLDAYKTSEDARINIYSPKRQKELQELLDYLARFKPTKIVVESGRNTGYLINNFKDWKQGKEALNANERSQIGMRLVDRFKLDTIYGVDAWPLLLELKSQKDTTLPKTYTDKILERFYFGGKDAIQQRYAQLYEHTDKMQVNHTLLESFKYLNSEKTIDRSMGAYITGGQFDSENFEGADALSMFWINRNLRIYRNIQKLGFNENDRVLILFGSGHISLLRYFFKSSPQFEVIAFSDLK